MPFTRPETLEGYRALVESTGDVLLIADWETARFVDANDAALSQLGYTIGELKGLTGGDLSQFPREEHRRISEDLIERGETNVRGVPIRCKDGTLLRMDLWVKKFQLGSTLYNATLMRRPASAAVDHRFRIDEGRLQASEAFYRGVVTCTEDAVVVTDASTGECIEANPAACALFGYSTVEFRSVRRQDLWAQPMEELLVRVDGEIEKTGRARTVESRLRRGDGGEFIGDTMENAFENQGRRMIITVIRDVSERRAQREQLERSQRLAAVGEVAAGVAHEINNPAAFVLMNADVIEGQIERVATLLEGIQALAAEDPERRAALQDLAAAGPDLESLRESVRDNREGVERIRAVSRDLRLFSRVDARVIVEQNVNEAVRGAIKLLRNELRHHAKVRLDLAEELPVIAAQRGKLGQVVANLLLNALQAITEGRAGENEIRITTVADGPDIVLRVTDSGTGIDEETLSHVFEPFFTTKAPEQGTGLGLPLCASIVAAHGGSIDVQSELGVGTTFEVRLPIDNGLVVSRAVKTTPAARTSKRRVLVVDDDPGMVRAYRRMLREHDATVIASGIEALDLLADDEDFDLILCDLMMPEMDGPQLYENLAERTPHLLDRVVFCTGGAFTQRAREFVARVENEVVEKPLTRADLARLLG